MFELEYWAQPDTWILGKEFPAERMASVKGLRQEQVWKSHWMFEEGSWGGEGIAWNRLQGHWQWSFPEGWIVTVNEDSGLGNVKNQGYWRLQPEKCQAFSWPLLESRVFQILKRFVLLLLTWPLCFHNCLCFSSRNLTGWAVTRFRRGVGVKAFCRWWPSKDLVPETWVWVLFLSLTIYRTLDK